MLKNIRHFFGDWKNAKKSKITILLQKSSLFQSDRISALPQNQWLKKGSVDKISFMREI